MSTATLTAVPASTTVEDIPTALRNRLGEQFEIDVPNQNPLRIGDARWYRIVIRNLETGTQVLKHVSVDSADNVGEIADFRMGRRGLRRAA